MQQKKLFDSAIAYQPFPMPIRVMNADADGSMVWCLRTQVLAEFVYFRKVDPQQPGSLWREFWRSPTSPDMQQTLSCLSIGINNHARIQSSSHPNSTPQNIIQRYHVDHSCRRHHSSAGKFQVAGLFRHATSPILNCKRLRFNFLKLRDPWLKMSRAPIWLIPEVGLSLFPELPPKRRSWACEWSPTRTKYWVRSHDGRLLFLACSVKGNWETPKIAWFLPLWPESKTS